MLLKKHNSPAVESIFNKDSQYKLQEETQARKQCSTVQYIIILPLSDCMLFNRLKKLNQHDLRAKLFLCMTLFIYLSILLTFAYTDINVFISNVKENKMSLTSTMSLLCGNLRSQ